MIASRIALAGMLILIAAQQAKADGCFFVRQEEVGRSSTMVASPKQEAILATDGQLVQVVLRTHFRAGPEELAWVVPVPAKPENIKKADDSVFSKLEEITAPRFYRTVMDNSGPILHFGCAVSGGRRVAVEPELVRVEESGTAGIFDYTVLAAEDPAALTKWLNDNKYHVPDGAEPVFNRYLQRKWHWLAMKVRPDAAASAKQGTLAPHPISYTYSSSELVFPLVISRLSADRENEIVLYVVGTRRYSSSDWANTTLGDIGGIHGIQPVVKSPTASSGTNYEELVRQQTGQQTGHLFVTEFSQPWELFGTTAGRGRRIDDLLDARLINSLVGRQTLTRLRAYVLAESMDRDVTLVPTTENRNVSASLQVGCSTPGPGESPALAATPALLAVPCLGVALPLRRRSSRRIRSACLVLMCIVILIL